MKHLPFLLFALAFGCTPIATYPPVENYTALAFSNPANEPVPTIMAETIMYAHKHFGGMDTIVFNLPVGIKEDVYSIVANKIGGATPMTRVDQVAYHITELRVRGFDAEAEVVFPSASSEYEMATIKLKTSIGGPWGVTDYRVWKIPVRGSLAPSMPTTDIAEVDTTAQ